ncbi:MAG: hypothetical protein JWQ25_120, partial [Daejeonella sp.]|nr:hypothetical protein [Daejeonella sp.]
MTIIFICSSLEPGKDGVGDYTRRLAVELARQGHTAVAIALHDKHTTTKIELMQEADGTALSVLRLPSVSPWKQRFKLARQKIEETSPDWLSLQFVPFGFSQKGLPLLFVYYLKKLIKNRKLQIMMHELWVGRKVDAFLKMKITSTLQEAIIKRMIRTTAPSIIHTHLPAYYLTLTSFTNRLVKPLPLFPNIPVNSSPGNNIKENILRIGFFSQVESNQAVTDFLSSIAEKYDADGSILEILLIGGSSERMRLFAADIERIEKY